MNKTKEQRKKESELIVKIVDRGYPMMKGHYKTRLDMIMDIDATNENCPLRLQELLDADDANFYHDIISIISIKLFSTEIYKVVIYKNIN